MMKHPLVLILTFLLVMVSLQLQAQDAMLALLSPNQRTGIEEYQNALGAKVSSSGNGGLINYNETLLAQNSCLRDLSRKMYDAIERGPVEAKVLAINQTSRSPGYFWEIALRYANNDPNLALQMIGICGHDNMYNSETFKCPKTESVMEKVIATQGDNGDGSFIPAKYYHVMAAASTSCILLRRGVPKLIAKSIALTAANAYRNGYTCHGVREQYEPRTNEYWDVVSNGQHSQYWNAPPFSQHPANVRREKAKIFLSGMDARTLLYNNLKIRSECRSGGFSPKLMQMLKTGSYRKGEVTCPRHWPSARCEQALHKLDTWEVDRIWTEAQHAAGFEFAAQHCQNNITDSRQINASACRALEVLNQGPVDPNITIEN